MPSRKMTASAASRSASLKRGGVAEFGMANYTDQPVGFKTDPSVGRIKFGSARPVEDSRAGFRVGGELRATRKPWPGVFLRNRAARARANRCDRQDEFSVHSPS
jgi:hypothetical protein